MGKRTAPQASSSKAKPAAPATSSSKPAKRARFEGPAVTKSAAAPKPAPRQSKQAKQEAAIKAAQAIPTPPAPTTFTVSAGSYERLLYGLSCSFVPTSKPSTITGLPYELVASPIFSFPAHLSSLKSVASSLVPSPGTGSERKVGGKYLVSGGTDEVVKVWDLKRRKEVGSLEGDASGTITCLRFVSQRNMLLAASTDSTITLYRVRDWVLLRALKGHKGRVNSIDAHPAGRVALSVGQDKMLRMWDLVAGKAVATMKVGSEGDLVRWNTNGSKFVVICGSNLTVYGIDMTILHALTAPSRFHDAQFCYFPLDTEDPTQREYLFVACEDGKTRIFDVSSPAVPLTEELDPENMPSMEPVAQLVGHANRVKQLDLLEVALPTPEPSSTIIVTSVSSDGKINLYDLSTLSLSKDGSIVDVSPSASYDTDGTRLTCVCAIGMAESKRQRTVDDGGEEESSSEEEDSDEEGAGEVDEEESEEESEEELEFDEEEEDEDEEEGEEE